MARKKVKLAFIEKRTDRKTRYKKRQKGFVKKAQELTTLCGVEMASVMYNPFQKELVHVFPNQEAAVTTFTKFRALPTLTQSKNMMTTDEFTKKRIEKMKEKLQKLRKENDIKEITNLMNEVMKGKDVTIDIDPADVHDLMFVMRQNLKQMRGTMKNKADGEGSTSNASQSISGPMLLDETSLEGPTAPLLALVGGPISMVPLVSPSPISGGTTFEGPRVPLLVPDVTPMWEVPTVAPPIISSAPTVMPQQLVHLADTLRTPPQMVPLLDSSWIPPFSSFSSQIFSLMAPQMFSSISQQMDVRRTSVIAPQIPSTTMDFSISSPMTSSPMYASVFPPATPQIDPSMNIPSMGASLSMNNYQNYSIEFPQSPALSESID